MQTNSCLSCFAVLAHGFMMRSVRYYSISLISYQDLWLSKLKARSGQVGKFNFSDWLGCDLPENAMTCEICSLQSLQFCSKNIFVEKVVFHLNIAFKTVFLSYVKKINVLKFPLGCAYNQVLSEETHSSIKFVI